MSNPPTREFYMKGFDAGYKEGFDEGFKKGVLHTEKVIVELYESFLSKLKEGFPHD